MSTLKHIQSCVQIGDHNKFIEVIEKARENWQTNSDARAAKILNKHLEERPGICAKRNKKIFVRLGWTKRYENEYSSVHYFNSIWNIFSNKMTKHVYYTLCESGLEFINESDRPQWWIEHDFVCVYNMRFAARKGEEWKFKMDEILKVAKDNNAAQLFVDSELYEYILNWSSKNDQ